MDAKSKLVLVIDDAHELRNEIIELLKFAGYQVEGAENGFVGTEAAKSLNPDLIICDIMMPELDGYGVLEAIRKDERLADTPFIFLTAKTASEDIRRARQLGADDYITKPFAAEDLFMCIDRLLTRQN